jgi:hypothetical protein
MPLGRCQVRSTAESAAWPASASAWYADTDEDGYGDPGSSDVACDAPSGFVDDATDCDDSDADISPEGVEVCDEADNDCDGTTDEDDATDAATWYADTDSDGYGDASSTTRSCEEPSGYVSDDSDCDDTDADVSPEGVEVCDEVDNDCDGGADDDDPEGASDASTWYADTDSDGYGDATDTTACDEPSGYTDNDDDCDDTDGDVNPAATEVCDEVDNDCDGTTDPDTSADAATWYADTDEDGYGDATSTTTACDEPTGYTDDDTDCDDTDADVNPGASETCDGTDEDCDGDTDEDVLGDDSACAAESCAEILAARPSATDGTYYVDPDGSGAISLECDMTIDGGGWTAMTGDYLAGLSSGVTREYLYTYGGAWYLSPETTQIWDWSSYYALEGDYYYGASGSTSADGSFSCTHVESGYWGIGCSNGPGGQWKTLPWGPYVDTSAGYASVCQDQPDVFGVGACAYPAQIWVRP